MLNICQNIYYSTWNMKHLIVNIIAEKTTYPPDNFKHHSVLFTLFQVNIRLFSNSNLKPLPLHLTQSFHTYTLGQKSKKCLQSFSISNIGIYQKISVVKLTIYSKYVSFINVFIFLEKFLLNKIFSYYNVSKWLRR